MADFVTLAVRHERLGWWGLVVFGLLGVGLESLHAFKADWLLNADHEARRLTLRLAHAHGTLLSLVHVVYGLSLRTPRPGVASHGVPRGLRVASTCLVAGTVLMPLGFSFGALGGQGGDPGPAVAVVPAGAVLVLTALALIGREASRAGPLRPPTAAAAIDAPRRD